MSLAQVSCFSIMHRRYAATWTRLVSRELDAIKQAGTWKTERVIASRQGAKITVKGSEKPVINFCANNYLGLSAHPEVIKASVEAAEKRGAGLSSVRFICGTQDIHKELEEQLARFHSREDAILYASCFDANAGLFETLLTSEDAVFSDELNHASIIDGVRLSKAVRYRYKHRDMNHLEQLLGDSQERMKLIATDGVFSMDGNVAPLREITELADRYGAIVFVDECHATGFFGETGRGTEQFLGVQGRADIINSTLGKALGGAVGGYTTGPKCLIDLLRQRSRPYLFSNSLPPTAVGGATRVLELIDENPEILQRIKENTELFRSEMTSAGFKVLGDSHPICPVWLGDAKLAAAMADAMLHQGIYVIGFSYPVVPKNQARIRVQISGAHSEEDINTAVEAFIRTGKDMKIV